ncbi:MAG: hypothetical protein JWQ02_1991 [Capsulimonas sp.]|jgi:hypothetical protein|nr:hypothetical protein [Capsulimonas sp.]
MTTDQITKQFLDALFRLESRRDIETISALFAEQSEIGNILAAEKYVGPAGAHEFWTLYRGVFSDVHSNFRNVIACENRAALEWTTAGRTPEGAPVTYSGVSILETNDQQITRFQAYFDPSNLGRQMEAAPTQEIRKATAMPDIDPTQPVEPVITEDPTSDGVVGGVYTPHDTTPFDGATIPGEHEPVDADTTTNTYEPVASSYGNQSNVTPRPDVYDDVVPGNLDESTEKESDFEYDTEEVKASV